MPKSCTNKFKCTTFIVLECPYFNTSDYTILSTNYTGGSAQQSVQGLLFRNYCLSDYGTELASFHSQNDDDLYFDLIIQYQNHPYGLKFMDCSIGLTNRSYENSWQWYDGTAYNWGISGTNTCKWEYHINGPELRCVEIDNSLNNRKWISYSCVSTVDVHCGACRTPTHRPYLLELTGTWDDISTASSNGYVLLWVQLNGTDLFGNGIDSTDFKRYTVIIEI